MKTFSLYWQGRGWYSIFEETPVSYAGDRVGKVYKPSDLGEGYIGSPKWFEDPEKAFLSLFRSLTGQKLERGDGINITCRSDTGYLLIDWRGPGWYAPQAQGDVCHLAHVSSDRDEYPETLGLGLGTPEWCSSISDASIGFEIEELWRGMP